jgi:pimeloyl-ACP methyl ester carboxylesterase
MKMIFSGLIILAFLAMGLLLLIYTMQEKFIFIPSRLAADYEYQFETPFEELFLEPEKGVTINVLQFKVSKPKGVILYFHGNAGDLSGWGQIAPEYTSRGYDVIMPDYRGYGKSRGRMSEDGLYRDAEFIYAETLKKYKEEEVIVFGRSIGTGIASYIASRHNPGLLILESPYFNLPDLTKQLMPIIPAFLIRYQFPNNVYLTRAKCRIVLIHGTDDELIDHRSSIRLRSLLKPEDKLFLIDGGHHNDLSVFSRYQEILDQILM